MAEYSGQVRKETEVSFTIPRDHLQCVPGADAGDKKCLGSSASWPVFFMVRLQRHGIDPFFFEWHRSAAVVCVGGGDVSVSMIINN